MSFKQLIIKLFYIFSCLNMAIVLVQSVSQQQQLAWQNYETHFNQTLERILIPRVVGSLGHTAVRNFILSELQTLGFYTYIDDFTTTVPIFGQLTFGNIIGIINPKADNFLSLACHYDSKYFTNNPNFVGAIDSAVPCSMILNIAYALKPYLQTSFKNRQDLGLMLIFFDGEEAFQTWSEYDSLYGSRNLARKLSNHIDSKSSIRQIDRIEVLVLLDLIGAENPKFYSFHHNTHILHKKLCKIEQDLFNANELEGHNRMFFERHANTHIDDDHRPFQQQNVPILHLITVPFSPQWHTPDDDAAHLHWPTIRNINKILQHFVLTYLKQHIGSLNLRV